MVRRPVDPEHDDGVNMSERDIGNYGQEEKRDEDDRTE